MRTVKTFWPLIFLVTLIAAMPSVAAKPDLKFKPDGIFKVVMFSDTQDDEDMDPRTTALMEMVLDTEKPDMVIIAGDCIFGADCENAENVKKAISNVAYPMEKRNIPWAIVFGNHDQEHFPKTHMTKETVLGIYASYPHNLNDKWVRGISGVGNNDLLVKGSTGKSPEFVLWLIDSGSYAREGIGGYDWIHADQIDWYRRTSIQLEKKCGHKVPGLMFFHIPLPEFGEMFAKSKVLGDRYESESPANVNSGMFAAVLDRGDVKGIFVGHEHVNNYIGDWMGVKLGYDASAGFGTYGLPDDNPNKNRAKGARVFEILESNPGNFQTWMRFCDGTKE